jgi:uncharacterized protein (TIGR02996 family)
MTTEDDFQKVLDANPSDHHTLFVFADWLQERDDPRADGYRALGVNRRWPYNAGVGPDGQQGAAWWCTQLRVLSLHGPDTSYDLPHDWFLAIEGHGDHENYRPFYRLQSRTVFRREMEDAAALAFVKLPAARQAELLAVQPVEVTSDNQP